MNGTVTMQQHTGTFTRRELAEIALESVKLANAKNDTHGMRVVYSDIKECNIIQYASDTGVLPILEWENEMLQCDSKVRIEAGYWKQHHVAWDSGKYTNDDCRFYVMLDDIEVCTISRERWESYLDEMLVARMINEDRRYVLIEEVKEVCRYKQNPNEERNKWENGVEKRDKKLKALEGDILKLTGRDKMFEWPCKIFCEEWEDKWWRYNETVLVFDYPNRWVVMEDDDASSFLVQNYDGDCELYGLPNDMYFALYRLLRENGLCMEPPKVSVFGPIKNKTTN
jgi:hypothetical protein